MAEQEALLRRAWVSRLYEEHAYFCFQYGFKLKKPLIQLHPYDSKWGNWDEASRTISLSERLVKEHPWEKVLEVLKHEMAHQIVSELFGADEGHGPLFREVCSKLAMAPWAMKSDVDLDGVLQESYSLTSEETRLLQRVDKLLNLANSANEHEAWLAMKMAQDLYTKYQLEQLKGKEAPKFTYRFLKLKKKRVERYQVLVGTLLHEHFFVEVLHTELFDSEAGETFKAIEISGTPSNLEMAEHVFHFLMERSAAFWDQYRKQQKISRRSRHAYLVGLISGFSQKLEKNRTEGQETSRSAPSLLPVLHEQAKLLSEYLHTRYPRTRRLSSGRRRYEASAFDAGRREGQALNLSRPLRENSKHKGGLLPRV